MTSRIASVLTVLALALAGCGGDGDPGPPEISGRTPTPANDRPLPDDLQGTWRTVHNNAAQYISFSVENQDCGARIDTTTCLESAGPTPDKVYLVSRLVATETQIVLDNEIRTSLVGDGPEPCPAIAAYAYRIDGDKLRLLKIQDSCASRVRLFESGDWERQDE